MATDVSISYSEVRIPVPWGHIAGRWYGDQNERPILALHGWQDNCGSFAKLAPLIAPYRSLLCVDLPGHGHSSHLPIGILYHNVEFVRVILRLMEIYKWKKVSLMGHSMGGSVAFHFAAFYPDRVDMVISLDIIKNFFWQPKVMPTVWAHTMEKALKDNDRLLNSDNSEPPSYTFRECEKLLYEGSQQSVDLENCKYILERNISKSELFPDKYYFSRDGRVKYLAEFNPDMQLSLVMGKRICKHSIPYLVIKGGKSTNISAVASELDDCMIKNNANFESFIYAEGTHHLHLNHPKPVAQMIIGFLQKHEHQPQQSQMVKAKL
ncbi:probable serine hydrolase [Stomoxys calcitrans]|uniref:AB hydrolase-1 domain-containing protein n=1 Tax=Stomoxys calcitrans TaxID=35570 RepID=A0A1I8NSV5_STOCA|nr:probable serine hydrolase [Stomoxys calcitrans]